MSCLRCRLLVDEDTAATNFMIRSAAMQRLVAPEKEPITPFIAKVRALADSGPEGGRGVSSILVLGIPTPLAPLFSRPLFARFAPSFRRYFAVSGFMAPRRRERAKNGVKWAKFGG